MILRNIVKSKLIKRYKRFLMDCELEDGTIVTAHCPNSGSMKSLNDVGNEVFLEKIDNPKGKLNYKAHILRERNGVLACINTHLPNKIVYDAIVSGEIPELKGFDEIRGEVKYGSENSRIDIWLKDRSKETFVEVKNVTLMEEEEPSIAQFPDSVTSRGAKHLRELVLEVERGNRTVMFYLINRSDCDSFKIAEHIDKKYKEEFNLAVSKGVEIIIYRTKIEIKEETIEMEMDREIDHFHCKKLHS